MRKKETIGKNYRKTYSKPKLEQVQLVAEEAVLEGCKTAFSGTDPRCYPRASDCARGGSNS